MRVSVSAISATLARVSRCSFSQASVNFMALLTKAAGKRRQGVRGEAVMLEPAEVRGEEGAQVRHAIFQHGDAVDAHAEGEALIALWIEPDVAKHVRMDHAAAENLQPLVACADPDLVADLGIADTDFRRWLGEGVGAR